MTTVTIAWIITSLSFIGCGVFALHQRRNPKRKLSDIVSQYKAPPPPINQKRSNSIAVFNVGGIIGVWNIKYCTCEVYKGGRRDYITQECEVCRKKRERIENEFIEIVSNVASSCGVTVDELKALQSYPKRLWKKTIEENRRKSTPDRNTTPN